MPFSKEMILGASGNKGVAAFYDHQIQHSMRFDRADNTYLSRTPSSEISRLKWSISFWHKCTQPNRLLSASNNYHQWWRMWAVIEIGDAENSIGTFLACLARWRETEDGKARTHVQCIRVEDQHGIGARGGHRDAAFCAHLLRLRPRQWV